MVTPIPKWVMQRYAKLYNKYGNKSLSFEDVQETLKADGRNTISVFLNELKAAGWVEVSLDDKDSRKRKYLLTAPQEVIKEMK